MDRMESATYLIIRHFILILLFCYGASGQCSKQAIVDGKTVKFHSLQEYKMTTNISLKYDAQGLQPLFDLANSFMDTVQPKKFGVVFKDAETKKFEDWKWVVKKYYISIAVCIGIGILFMIFMPIVGFCFCCCRCCGKCGGDMKQSEKKSQQHCKVAFMIFLLFLFTILILCGTLFMFVTNNRLSTAYDGNIQTYDEAIDEAVKMSQIIVDDIKQLTNDQVPCVTDLLRNNLAKNAIKNRIGYPLRNDVQQNVSVVLTEAIAASQQIDVIVSTITNVETLNRTFTTNAADLKTKLNEVKQDLTNVVIKCKSTSPSPGAICDQLESIKLDTQMDFNSLPNIEKYLNDMKKVKDLDLNGNIQKANKTVNDIPDTVVTKSTSAIQSVKKFLTDTDKSIAKAGKNISDDIEREVDKYKNDITTKNEIYKQLKDGDYNTYERIRWKVYVALSALMAFFVFLLLCGISCGSCGYNKEYMPTERTTTSNCGGNFLMAVVGLMFIFSFILMIFCVIWFAVGIHFHLACREVKDGEIIDSIVNIFIKGDSVMKNISVKEILTNCRKDVGIYRSTPYIEEKFNLTKMFDMSKMEKIKSEINDNINFDLSTEKIINTDTRKAIDDLITSDINNINFTSFFNILDDKITSRDLTEIIANLTDTAASVRSSSPEIADNITAIATKITNIKDGVIVTLKENIKGLNASVQKLQQEILNIQDRSKELLKKLEAAESYIMNNAPNMIKQYITDMADDLFGYSKQGVDHILNQMKSNVAKCKPIANIYDGVVNTYLCDNLVQNMNGFWLALGWCLLFFIPAIILSVKLAKYFRRMDYTAGMDTIVVDHPPYNDKLPPHHDMRPPPPYTSTQHSNPGYQHV